MYHINVILIFFIAFLVKIRVLAQKSCQFRQEKSLAERKRHLGVSPKCRLSFFLEKRNKNYCIIATYRGD